MSEGRLDIQVNTGSVKQAIIDLDKLPASTARAEAAATKLTTGFDKAGAGATMMGERIAAAANSASGIASKLNGAMDMSNLDKTLQSTVADLNIQNVAVRNGTTAASAHGESIRGQRLALRGLAQDLMFLGPAYGQSAAMAATLYIDNMHLIGGWSGLKTAIGALLTPMNLLIGGGVAVAAGMYMLNSSITETEKKFGDLADRTNTTVMKLHALESTTAFKGIDTSEFITGMEKFGDLTSQAQVGLGSLKDLFRANGVASGDIVSNLEHAADLIQNARSEAEKYRLIQQLGLPPTREWVQMLSQGADGIRQAQNEASKLGGAFDEQMIKKAREFDEAWDKGWKNFTTAAKQAFIDVKGGVSDIITWANHLGQDLHPGMLGLRLNNAFGDVGAASDSGMKGGLDRYAGQLRSPTGANTVDPEVLRKQISDAQPFVGLFGSAPTAAEIAKRDRDEAPVLVAANDNEPRMENDRGRYRRTA
jgi:hypothetical protein